MDLSISRKVEAPDCKVEVFLSVSALGRTWGETSNTRTKSPRRKNPPKVLWITNFSVEKNYSGCREDRTKSRSTVTLGP
jgi:hypothetical protein